MQTPAAPARSDAMESTASSDQTTTYSDVIDLRKVKAYERLPLLELSFSVLEPGDELQVVFEMRPTRFERYLQTHYADHLEWWSLDSGEEWFTLGIRCLTRISAEAE